MEYFDLGHFSISVIETKVLARGTHGDVQKVKCQDGRTLALKKIRLPLQLGEEKTECVNALKLQTTYEDEKKALCILEHVNVVRFYGMILSEQDSSVYLVMEMILGETLENFINGEVQSEDVIRTIAGQVCNALSYLHGLERIVLHRDINCRTIMVCENNRVKLINFGLAVQLLESASDHLSTDPRGNPCFMAPEIFLCEQTEKTPYSCASDIWAFGCVLYQMATGKKPHADCRNMLAIVRRVMRLGAPQLPDANSEQLKEFYRYCTAAKHAERWPAARLLQHEFLSERALTREFEKLSLTAGHDATCENQPDINITSADQSTEATDMPCPGLCLIINLEQYEDPKTFPHLPAAQADAEHIRFAFKKLGFQVVQKDNPKATELWEFLQSVAGMKSQLEEHRCFVCFILGYGSSGLIYTIDAKAIELRLVLSRFQASQCPSLKGKPKLFFIQTGTAAALDELDDLGDDCSVRMRDKEFMVCTGVTGDKDGSSFVAALCDVIESESFRHEDIECVVSEVNIRLGLGSVQKEDRFCGQTHDGAVSNLVEKFYLNPRKEAPTATELLEDPEKWTDEQLTRACHFPADASKRYGPMEQVLLIIAAIRGKEDLVAQLLNLGAQDQPVTTVNTHDVQGRTAVSWAALKGHGPVLKAFVKAFGPGSDALKMLVNTGDNLKQTPIILAAKHHQTAIIDLLRSMGGDINLQDSMQQSALMYAAKQGFEDTVSLLLSLGADETAVDFSRNSPLIWAARCGHLSVIRELGKRLLKKPADVVHWMRKGERDMDAREWASFCGHSKCANYIGSIIRQVPLGDRDGVPDPLQEAEGNCGDAPSDDQTAQLEDHQETDGGGARGGGGSGGEDRGRGGGGGGGGGSGPPPHYPMLRQRRRLALIINIVDFPPDSGLPRRDGAMQHMDRLFQSFTRLGFECMPLQNIRSWQFRGLLNIVHSLEEYDNDAFLLCIMSHGVEGYVYETDGLKVSLEEVFAQFRDPVRCPALRGKPKIFIVQACRANLEHRVVPRQVGQAGSAIHGDCLYIYSVVKGHACCYGNELARNRMPQYHFVRALCDVLLNAYDTENDEFLSALPKVVWRVIQLSEGRQVVYHRSTTKSPLKFPLS